jgi:hypothetical protein
MMLGCCPTDYLAGMSIPVFVFHSNSLPFWRAVFFAFGSTHLCVQLSSLAVSFSNK